MQAQQQQRPDDSRLAILISLGVGAVVAVVTIATFYWIYELASGPERRGAEIAAAAPYDLSDEVTRIVNSPPNVPAEGDTREPWLGADAWQAGVQAGQEYIDQFPQPQNVQILTGMSTAQIWVYMQQYVSGALGVGCQYCHDIQNYAADPYPQKISARLMMVMTNDVNAEFIVNLPEWKGNYVQCATCHNGAPINMPSWAPEFENTEQPINVNVTPIDGATGAPIIDPAEKPEELREAIPLKDAILYKVYNYEVWKPYAPGDPDSARGTLALTYETEDARGPSQDQVNISQGAMNYMGWSLGVSCIYCHNSRNFYALESEVPGATNASILETYAINRLKTQQMLLLTTWMTENWSRYNILPKTGVTATGPGAVMQNQQYLVPIDEQYYAVPGCYTCHQGNAIPRAAINQSQIPEGDAGVAIFPPVLRGESEGQE